MYNPAIGKFLSFDPLAPDYPELTPYQFASNMPIWGSDLDGLEFNQETIDLNVGKTQIYTQAAGEIGTSAGVNIQILPPATPQVGYWEGASRYAQAKAHQGYPTGEGGGNLLLEYTTSRYLWKCDCNYGTNSPFFDENNVLTLPKAEFRVEELDVVTGQPFYDFESVYVPKIHGKSNQNMNPHTVYEVFGFDSNGNEVTIKHGETESTHYASRKSANLSKLRPIYENAKDPKNKLQIKLSGIDVRKVAENLQGKVKAKERETEEVGKRYKKNGGMRAPENNGHKSQFKNVRAYANGEVD